MQSKLDALKHGVETADGTGSSDSGEVVTSEVSLLKQLEDDKEALERKDKEVLSFKTIYYFEFFI